MQGKSRKILKQQDNSVVKSTCLQNNKSEKTYKTDIIVTVEKSIINIEMNKDYYKGINNKNNQLE